MTCCFPKTIVLLKRSNLLKNLLLFSQVMFSMFNKLLICLCLADLMFLVSNIAVSPVSLQVCQRDRPAIWWSSSLRRSRGFTTPRCITAWSASVTSVSPPRCSSPPAAPWRGTRSGDNRILICAMFKEKRQTELTSDLLSDLRNLTSSTFN